MRKGLSLSRREFLVGVAAVAGPLSWFPLGAETAFPRGRERYLLTHACSPEKLKQALIPRDKFHPFPTNNWDAWICWNWLTTSLLLDRNEDRRYRSVQKIAVCLDQFINTYPDDGGCEEGPGYWNVVAGAMFDALELFYSATLGAVDIFANPLVTQMALYMNRVHISGEYYLNQGDASPIIQLDVDKMYRFGKRLKNQDLIDLAVSSIPSNYHPESLPAIFHESELRAQPAVKARLLRDTWLTDTHIMAARIKTDSAEGFYLACIAADNGKSHSHNDTGSFWVYSNGSPVLMDMGQETYQKKSFGAHRYEIPSMQSAYHTCRPSARCSKGQGLGSGLPDWLMSRMIDGHNLGWNWRRRIWRSPG
jgi:hypothetical protein